jgi:hypothetical protein
MRVTFEIICSTGSGSPRGAARTDQAMFTSLTADGRSPEEPKVVPGQLLQSLQLVPERDLAPPAIQAGILANPRTTSSSGRMQLRSMCPPQLGEIGLRTVVVTTEA